MQLATNTQDAVVKTSVHIEALTASVGVVECAIPWFRRALARFDFCWAENEIPYLEAQFKGKTEEEGDHGLDKDEKKEEDTPIESTARPGQNGRRTFPDASRQDSPTRGGTDPLSLGLNKSGMHKG